MYKLFEKMNKEIYKSLLFSQNPLTFYYRTCTGKIISILFSFIFGIGKFELIFSELLQKEVVGRTFKATQLRHFAL